MAAGGVVPTATVGLVGRQSLVSDIVGTLTATPALGVLVVGDPGLGKTALSRAIADALAEDVTVVQISAQRSLRKVPFGALAPYLTELTVADAGSPIAIYRGLTKHLGEPKAGAPAPLFIVDDAHDLDDSTSILLAQLIATRRAQVLVLARSTPGPPSEFLSLWHDGMLLRYDLGPLNREEIHELCVRELGSEVLSNVSALLSKTSRGNPMFLLALLHPDARSKYLVQRNGVWCLSGERPEIDLRLTDLIKGQLRGRSPAELDALETVALAEPVAMNVLRENCDSHAVDTLVADQLLALTIGPDRRVALAHPLYGEVIRAQVPVGRSLTIRRRLLKLSEEQTESIEGFLRWVSWGLDCGAVLDDATLLKAAIVANRLYDPAFALRAARVVQTPVLKSRALVEIAHARVTRGDFAYARELVDEAFLNCDSLRIAKEATLLSIDLRMIAGANSGEIQNDVNRWTKTINRIEQQRDGASSSSVRLSRMGCRLLSCFVLNLDGRFSESEKLLREINDESDGTDETRLAALALLGEALGSTGRPLEGAAVTKEALTIIAENGHRFLRHQGFVITRHGMCLIRAGRWKEISNLLVAYSQAASGGMAFFGGILEYFEGIVALRQGRMRTARKRLMLAVEGFRESDVAQLLTMATGMAAYACSMAGDNAGAQQYSTEFAALPPHGSLQARLQGRIHVVSADAKLRGSTASISELRRIAEHADSAGMSTLSATAYELAVRLGDSSSLAPLSRITSEFDGNDGAIVSAMAAAMLAKDATALEAAAQQAQNGDYFLIAAECLGMAINLLSQHGQTQRSRALQPILNTVVEKLEGLHGQQFSESQSVTKLTQREQDIVSLASQGHSNRDIAELHGVSVRTVEGHLYRIFAKLGISRREDLQDLNQT
ncbi:AAA family ATPase [Arthrobacter sp. H20]|uniref:helix-turn-helix transcriptional regulator n=1 Tax=Arthrobacter sp. H20 TaxID=1267981 RepID=UPI00047DF076|nr:AAA family ATPase [Arthrobacter sp. H20]